MFGTSVLINLIPKKRTGMETIHSMKRLIFFFPPAFMFCHLEGYALGNIVLNRTMHIRPQPAMNNCALILAHQCQQ